MHSPVEELHVAAAKALPEISTQLLLASTRPGGITVLCAWCCCQLFEHQEEEQSSASREREVRAEVTRRIKQLGQQRKFKEAVQELASLATLGIQPDTQAATALLAACTRSRDMKMAQSVFEQLFGEPLCGQGSCQQLCV